MKSITMLILAMIFLFTSFSTAEYSYQRNWFGGPGVPGPTTWWGATFASSENMSYAALQMYLFLGISSTQHVISSYFPDSDFAFPVDMDGDGDIDVVSSSPAPFLDYRVSWFENDGSGQGWAQHIVEENAVFNCVYPGDIDLDGDIDLVGGNKASSAFGVDWWRNVDGVGDSWTRLRVADWGSPEYICFSDINGDDTLEIVGSSWGPPNEIAWFESTTWPPDTNWTSHQVAGGIVKGRELYTVDLDQDGDIDVVSANEDQDGLKWFENSDGIGLTWTEHDIAGYYDLPFSVHASDIDGDGDIDVVYCSQDEDKAVWCENLNGVGTSWEEHVIDDPIDDPQSIHSVDLTNSGYSDVVVALNNTGSGSMRLYLYRNMDGTGSQWARFLLSSGSRFEDVDAGDFNQDGNEDILAAAGVGAYLTWHELEGHTDGWLLSSILDVTSYPQWDSVTWIAEEPAGTDIFFQVRASNDWEDMGAWCDTLFEPQNLTGVIDSTFRYIQYRVGMISDTEFATPVLEEVRFYWTFLGIEGGEGCEDLDVTVWPNPASSSVNISIPVPFISSTEILVYDVSGKLVRRFSDLETNTVQWDCCDSGGNQVPSGLYVVRAFSGDASRTARLIII